MQVHTNWATPLAHLVRNQPDVVSLYFSPSILQRTALFFLDNFDGLVTYAVKANDRREVLENLVAAGIRTFDVASPQEMHAVRAACGDATLHYNNPVRSIDEVATAISLGVTSYSIDSLSELDKLHAVPRGCEISVRLALPVKGAAYDFGAKFGRAPEEAALLLQQVQARGFAPAMTFHPGTQCADPAAWVAYINSAATVARTAGVKLARLNVGGGFAAHRTGTAPDVAAILRHIRTATDRAFGPAAPALVCEPGRAMVAEAFTLAARIKAIREDGAIFLNDGIYGGLSEARDMIMTDRIQVHAPDGTLRTGQTHSRIAFGPTCDSIDRLPEPLPLPNDIAEGDYILFDGLGAYSCSLSTRFNGYGLDTPITVAKLHTRPIG